MLPLHQQGHHVDRMRRSFLVTLHHNTSASWSALRPRTGWALAISLIVPCGFAQSPPQRAILVETVPTRGLLRGPDGATLDSAGNVFVANYGDGKGTTVVRIARDGQASVFVSGLNAPDGVVFDRAGRLYISNFGAGTIVRVTPDGQRDVFASGLDHPSGLAFDGAGNLYVSNFGNFDGTTVSRITPNGAVMTFARGFAAPIGLAFDRAGRLYVSNFASGIVNRVSSSGELSVFATITNTPNAHLQYLAFDAGDTLYVPSYGHHRVYRITPDARATPYAGTGVAGAADGPATSAQFDGPNSIVRANDGTLLVTDYNANRLRRIHVAPDTR